MKQDLENYLKEKRWELDVEEPNEDAIWSGIQNKTESKNFVFPSWFWKVAAIFLFAVLVTYTVTNTRNKNQVVVITLADISKNLGQEEAQLKHLVNLKWEEVESQLPADKNNLQFLFDELKELDKVYEDYQKDLYRTGPNEQIIEAMLDYYQKKIRLLNRMLLEIQKQKEHENII